MPCPIFQEQPIRRGNPLTHKPTHIRCHPHSTSSYHKPIYTEKILDHICAHSLTLKQSSEWNPRPMKYQTGRKPELTKPRSPRSNTEKMQSQNLTQYSSWQAPQEHLTRNDHSRKKVTVSTIQDAIAQVNSSNNRSGISVQDANSALCSETQYHEELHLRNKPLQRKLNADHICQFRSHPIVSCCDRAHKKQQLGNDVATQCCVILEQNKDAFTQSELQMKLQFDQIHRRPKSPEVESGYIEVNYIPIFPDISFQNVATNENCTSRLINNVLNEFNNPTCYQTTLGLFSKLGYVEVPFSSSNYSLDQTDGAQNTSKFTYPDYALNNNASKGHNNYGGIHSANIKNKLKSKNKSTSKKKPKLAKKNTVPSRKPQAPSKVPSKRTKSAKSKQKDGNSHSILTEAHETHEPHNVVQRPSGSSLATDQVPTEIPNMLKKSQTSLSNKVLSNKEILRRQMSVLDHIENEESQYRLPGRVPSIRFIDGVNEQGSSEERNVCLSLAGSLKESSSRDDLNRSTYLTETVDKLPTIEIEVNKDQQQDKNLKHELFSKLSIESNDQILSGISVSNKLASSKSRQIGSHSPTKITNISSSSTNLKFASIANPSKSPSHQSKYVPAPTITGIVTSDLRNTTSKTISTSNKSQRNNVHVPANKTEISPTNDSKKIVKSIQTPAKKIPNKTSEKKYSSKPESTSSKPSRKKVAIVNQPKKSNDLEKLQKHKVDNRKTTNKSVRKEDKPIIGTRKGVKRRKNVKSKHHRSKKSKSDMYKIFQKSSNDYISDENVLNNSESNRLNSKLDINEGSKQDIGNVEPIGISMSDSIHANVSSLRIGKTKLFKDRHVRNDNSSLELLNTSGLLSSGHHLNKDLVKAIPGS